MDGRLIVAIVTITLALIFYSIGVWSEHRSSTLKKWHVLTFWLGLVFDTTGTLTMTAIARDGVQAMNSLTGAIHAVSGGLAIVLMIFHAIWATIVINGQDHGRKQSFHRLSLVVWFIWLVPYFAGMFMGML